MNRADKNKAKKSLEDARAWLRAKTPAERLEVAKKAEYPIDTLNKFAFGSVIDPAFTRVARLILLMRGSNE